MLVSARTLEVSLLYTTATSTHHRSKRDTHLGLSQMQPWRKSWLQGNLGNGWQWLVGFGKAYDKTTRSFSDFEHKQVDAVDVRLTNHQNTTGI